MGTSSGQITDYGFTWGPWEIVRFFEHERGYFLEVKSGDCHIDIHLTPKGKKANVRVLRGEVEVERVEVDQ